MAVRSMRGDIHTIPHTAWLDNMLRQPMFHAGIQFLLAGGSILRSIEGQLLPPPDFDFFFQSESDKNKFLELMPGRVKPYLNQRVSLYVNARVWDVVWWPDPNYSPTSIQLIVPNKYNGTPQALFESFDLSPCMLAIDELGNFFHEATSLDHIKQKVFKVNPGRSPNQLKPRKQKLLDRGYQEKLPFVGTTGGSSPGPSTTVQGTASFAACECGADATGGGIHSDWCPRS